MISECLCRSTAQWQLLFLDAPLPEAKFLGMLTSPSWFAGRKAEFSMTVMKIAIQFLAVSVSVVSVKVNHVEEFMSLGY